MSTTTLNLVTPQYNERTAKPSVFTKFINWCANQEEKRLMWVGVGLSTHGCILTPITVLAILLAGSPMEMTFISLAVLAMVLVLVTNLAALPTKFTIPAFALSVVTDLILIIAVLV